MELQKDLDVEQKEQSNILNKLKQEHIQIKTKIQNWNLRCAEDNSITSIERNEVLKPLKEKQAEIETQIASYSISNDDFKITTFRLLELASKGYEIFKSSHTSQKHEFLNLVCANLKLNGEKLDVCYAKPFDVFAKYREFTEWSG